MTIELTDDQKLKARIKLRNYRTKDSICKTVAAELAIQIAFESNTLSQAERNALSREELKDKRNELRNAIEDYVKGIY